MTDVKGLIEQLRARAKYLGSPEPMERVSFSGEEALTLATALEQMQRELDEAREALKPFAEAAESIDAGTADRVEMWEHPASTTVTAGDFRRASALSPKEAAE